jgi:hypothetical protein
VCRLDAYGMQLRGRREGICSSEAVEQLKYLSEKCGGWTVWDEQVKGEKVCSKLLLLAGAPLLCVLNQNELVPIL